jgi:TPR repeat protein
MALAWGIVFSLTLAFAEVGLCENPRLKATLAKASAGDPVAQYELGRMYEFGEGVRTDSVTAAKWYRKAAEKDLARAQYSLGRMYASGDGVEQDWTKAAEWLRKAAAGNYVLAMNRLGVMCERGQGMHQDYIEAYKWYTRATQAGLISATNNRENLLRHMTGRQIAEAENQILRNPRPELRNSRPEFASSPER